MEIAKEDKVKCFDFLSEFENTIKQNFGLYNINDKHLCRFLDDNKIFLGKINKKDNAKALKSKYYIVFEKTKQRKKDNDVAHHLLRHIRNAIAHGHIIKGGKNKFCIKDIKESGNLTMKGNIGKREFFLLLDQLKQARG